MTNPVVEMAVGAVIDELYGASPITRRRRTKDEIEVIRAAMVEVLTADHPQSVRHDFYRLCGAPYFLVPKELSGYQTVQHQLVKLRDDGRVPWTWVSDGTRWRRQVQSFDSAVEAVEHVARYYRQDLWRRTPVYCEIWCESDSLAGVISAECDRYGAALMVSRGFSSRSYLHRAAMEIEEEGRPAYLYYAGDWDPAGKLIPEVIEARLREFSPGAEIYFERLFVTPEQIAEWDLPTMPAKSTTHSKGFTGGTVEAEAIPAKMARQLVREAIEQHVSRDLLEKNEIVEQSERELLTRWASAVAGGTA